VFSHGATTSSLGVHEQELSMAAFDMQAFGITQHQILNSIERLLSVSVALRTVSWTNWTDTSAKWRR